MRVHTITKAIVSGPAGSVLRARCSCGGFLVDAARLSTASRRRQERLMREHLTSTAGHADAAALVTGSAIECAP